MRIFLRGLTMTAVLLSASASKAVAEQGGTYVGDSSTEYYGPQYADADTYAEADNESIDGSSSILQASANAFVGDEPLTSSTPAPKSGVRAASMHSPTTAPYRAAGMRTQHSPAICESAPCGGSCDGSCDGGCDSCGTRSQMSRLMSGKCQQTWLQAEALLWFPQGRIAPPLAVVTPAGTNPLLTTPGATVFGTDVGNKLTAGFRIDAGHYFGDGTFGIGGRFWMLGDDKDGGFNLSGNGTASSIGRPYFDYTTPLGQTTPIGENSIAVATNGLLIPPNYFGSVTSQRSLSMMAAEGYGRFNLSHSRSVHLDLIGGYSYFNIQDDLAVQSISTLTPPSTGAVTTFRDAFNTSNIFNGGQIGAETILTHGRWTARSLTKVHLGDMNQQISINGAGTFQPTTPGTPTGFGGGLLAGGLTAQELNQTRDLFTFAPELNLKLGYRFRDHVTFNVGYSFIYWNHVALAGQQIDRNFQFDQNNPLGGVVRPSIPLGHRLPNSIQDAGFWVQGIDLGTTISF